MDLPERLGKYLLVERIAVGGMAEVYKARTAGLGGFEKVLAVKRLHAKYCQDVEFIKMLIDEAKIAVQLSHSNICQIFDLDRLDEHYFICMEYIDGRDLHRVMRRLTANKRKMPIDVACFIAREVCAGLDFAHRKVAQDGTPLRIIHRDVSPQNLLVSWEGEVKIIDFGIAKASRRAYETESGIIKGKFYYMSPEHARAGELDGRSDIFSLGIVLYEMLTGDFLYSGLDDTQETLLSRVRQAKVTPPGRVRREIPRRLDQIVMKALSKDPDDRYQSAAAFADALGSFLHQYYPRMGRPALAAFMRDHLRWNTDESKADRLDPGNLMSRVDYQVDHSSLIYDAALTEPNSNIAASASTRKVAAMPKKDTFDDDPFFSDSGANSPPRDASDVYELGDDDIDIIGDETPPASAAVDPQQGGEASVLETATTGVRKVDVPAELHEEAQLPDDVNDPLDDEPTQVYRPQAFLAGEPDAERGPLRGEARLDTSSSEETFIGEDEEATVITTLEDVFERRASSGRHSSPQVAVSGAQPIYIPQPSRGFSPALLVILFIIVLGLGAALAIGSQFLYGPRDDETEIAAPSTEIPAPSETAAVASYHVTTLPTGARVLLNGNFNGTTPHTITGLDVGSTYVLRLEYERHRTHEQALTPTASGNHSIAFTLDRLLGTIQVNTSPPAANVAVDGVYRDQSPTTLDGLDMRSSYVVSASLPGHLTASQQVTWPSESAPPLQAINLVLTPMELPPPVVATNQATSVPRTTNNNSSTRADTERTSSRDTSSSDRTSSRDRSSSRDSSSSDRTSSRDRSSSRDSSSSDRTSSRDRSSSRDSSSSDDSGSDDSELSERAAAARAAIAARNRDRDSSSSDSATSASTRDNDSSGSAEEEEEEEEDSDVGRLSVRSEPEGHVFINNQVVSTETPLLNYELEPGTHTVKVYYVTLREFSPERRIRVVTGETRSVYFRQR